MSAPVVQQILSSLRLLKGSEGKNKILTIKLNRISFVFFFKEKNVFVNLLIIHVISDRN
jgi:hypothetical protein